MNKQMRRLGTILVGVFIVWGIIDIILKNYDLILDAVGKISSSHSKRALKKNGRYISTNSSPINEKTEDLVFLKELIKTERIKTIIDRQYSLAQIPEAHLYVDRGHKKGNVVITVEHTV